MGSTEIDPYSCNWPISAGDYEPASLIYVETLTAPLCHRNETAGLFMRTVIGQAVVI